MEDKHGIKRVVAKRMRYWRLGERTLNINLIDGIGEFLILKSENPTKEFITDKLGISNPEYVTMPFSELKRS